MRTFPQPDGSLRIEQPNEQTIYDMGNRRLFVTFNGQGDVVRMLLPEGHHLGTWRLQLLIDGASLKFEQALAMGRLWQLRGEQAGVSVEITAFLEENSAIVLEQCIASNRTRQPHRLIVRIDLDFALPATLPQRIQATLARHIPCLPGLRYRLGQGWAKLLLPSSPDQVKVHPRGWIEARGGITVCWGATHVPQQVIRQGRRVFLQYPIDLPPERQIEMTWGLGAGGPEAHAAALARRAEALAEAQTYAQWLSTRLETGDRWLRSMFVAGLNTAIAMFKEFPGGFAGLLAGPDYAYPPRLYFRDSYWTAQVLLPFRPDLVRRHLLSLARGVHPNGQCPSGVFAPHLSLVRLGGLDWLPDHYDAPALFVLLLADYLQATGDWEILEEHIPMPISPGKPADGDIHSRTLWHTAQAALHYLISRDQDGDGLIEKPHAANDWADNVRRSMWVTYDQALYAAALQAASRIAAQRKEDDWAALYQTKAAAAIRGMNTQLWDPDKGYYVDYKREGFVEDHFAIDTLVSVLYHLTDPAQTRSILAAARQLQTRYNNQQPYGDWGVMNVFPLYRNKRDLFGKSALPYCYHNGADWPYWDGVYGLILLREGDPDWRYVLTRWWEYGLEQGWLTPVEYYSPAHPRGGMLQGWSSMPAAVLFKMNANHRFP